MKILVLIIALSASVHTQQDNEDIFSTELQACNIHESVAKDYQSTLYSFTTELYRKIGGQGLNQFLFAPLSGWLTLAAIAEGADPVSKQAIFQLLSLPKDPCVRLKYYQLAINRYVPGNDVNITNTRTLVIDEEVKISPVYQNFTSQNSLFDVVSAPMRRDPQTTLEEIRRITGAKVPTLDLSGNSVILEAVNFSGLWTVAFEDAIEEKAPFHNEAGEQIGQVDLMRMKKRAKMAYLRSNNVKILELPIGSDGRYCLMISLPIDANVGRAVNDVTTGIIDEYLGSFKESEVPIDIAIPRFTMTGEYDMKTILAEYSIDSLWTDLTATRFISEPSALPSAYVQRTTISLDNAGWNKPEHDDQPSNNETTGLDPILGQDFIANRPFLFSIADTETYSTIMAGAFTQPTYSI